MVKNLKDIKYGSKGICNSIYISIRVYLYFIIYLRHIKPLFYTNYLYVIKGNQRRQTNQNITMAIVNFSFTPLPPPHFQSKLFKFFPLFIKFLFFFCGVAIYACHFKMTSFISANWSLLQFLFFYRNLVVVVTTTFIYVWKKMYNYRIKTV